MTPQRIDQLGKAERAKIQRELIQTGFLDPVLPSGRPADDGIWGPITDHAYSQYWASRPVEIAVPIVAPAPVKPWWLTRRAIGLTIGLAGLIAQGFGYSIDSDQATEIVIRGIELGGEVMTYVGALIAAVGAWRAQAPIDPTLLARVRGRDVRLP